ncbi:MAG: methylated-DNA--[protein]-cysteine S-methyltransferase [Clostridiales bacterium]|jgi:methylated-DNA-[protein]-cysteine S-methyltransferase|nr:methylated-DNA--[protein]-cysteine S-methyltransferase [Clostridiales bacterium]
MNGVWFLSSPIGKIGIAENGGLITRVFFGEDIPSGFVLRETEQIKKAAFQLTQYFEKKLKVFDFPLRLTGTDFQYKVLNAVNDIPYGETRSYSDIAQAAGNIKAVRAVGMANNKNPLVIIIPCHRVIGKSGALTGYAAGLAAKRYLLELEGANNERWKYN